MPTVLHPEQLCSTPGCKNLMRYKTAQLCNRCYHRRRKYGSTTAVPRPAGGGYKAPLTPWGANITRLRTDRGLTHMEVCRRTGVDHNTFSRMIRGDGHVNLKFYLWVAQLFEVPLYNLFNEVSDAAEAPGSGCSG